MGDGAHAVGGYQGTSLGIQWFFWGVDEWLPFDEFENEELERAYLSGASEVGWKSRGGPSALVPKCD
jgi:hypothetical protein